MTANPFKAFFMGILLTIFIQSSSALTSIVLIFITTKLIDYKKGLIIIIGANIGTTFTSILISLSLTNYFVFFIVLGFILLISFKKEQIKLIGNTFIGIGFLFLGLYFIRENMLLIFKIPQVYEVLLSINKNNYLTLIISILVTALIQSSSASIGIIQEASGVNLFPLITSFIFVIGANIGTTITGLIVSFKGSKESKEVAIMNFSFNLIFGIIFLILMRPLSFYIIYIKTIFKLNNQQTIALYHIIFNIISSLILLLIVLRKDIYNKIRKT